MVIRFPHNLKGEGPVRFLTIAILALFGLLDVALADVKVRGYYRSDGTYVRPHYRSSPDRSHNNNWSVRGNVNPYTGQRGTLPRRAEPPSSRTSSGTPTPISPAKPTGVAASTPRLNARQTIVGRASVIDGDTFEIQGQTVRIWGIDAPGSAQTCYISGKPWRCGQKAALALADHLGQRTVACYEMDKDRYGRIVGKCSVDAQDIGAWLVEGGWAVDYPEYSRGGYAQYESTASNFKSGIWQGAFDKPLDWRKQ